MTPKSSDSETKTSSNIETWERDGKQVERVSTDTFFS